MAKRTYIAVIEIEKPYGTFHEPWVYEHSIETAVQAISGHTVKVSVPKMSQRWADFVQRLLSRIGVAR